MSANDRSTRVGSARKVRLRDEQARWARRRRLSLQALEERTLLANFTVINTLDSGAGSLRQAIISANANSGADSIDFSLPANSVIALAGSELTVTDDLTIVGPDANQLVVRGAAATRIMSVVGGVDLTMRGLTLEGSTIGGGFIGQGGALFISSGATVRLSRMTIEGGRATYGGGIYDGGTLILDSSTIDDNRALGIDGSPGASLGGGGGGGGAGLGGGLYVASGAVASVTNSTFSDNRAVGGKGGDGGDAGGGDGGAGGGLLGGTAGKNQGAVGTGGGPGGFGSGGGGGGAGSVIGGDGGAGGFGGGGGGAAGGNNAGNGGSPGVGGFGGGSGSNPNNNFGGSGGGGGGAGLGGGIFVDGGTLIMTYSTVASNSVSGGQGGLIAGLPSRAASGQGHGGGVFVRPGVGGTFNSLGNLLGLNSATTAAPDLSGDVVSAGYNLVQDPAGATGIIGPGEITGVNPLLGALQYAGGTTQVRPLLAGSPAINAGDASNFPSTDQRGRPRNVGLPDIGSFEFSNAFIVTNTNDSGAGSLRQAIVDANTAAGGTIEFLIGSAGLKTISPGSNLPAIANPTTIDASTQPGYTLGAPTIELRGGGGSGVSVGLTLDASGITVRGLLMDSYVLNSGIAIWIRNGGSDKIQGSVVGSASRPNDRGIVIDGGSGHNTIGTDGDGVNDAFEGNVISGNRVGSFGYGILLSGIGSNVVAGNTIGADASGTSATPNIYGVRINSGSSGNTIGTNADGTSDALERNIISGNSSNGVAIEGLGTTGNRVSGNYVGTNRAGSAAIPNNTGVLLFGGASGNTIGTNVDGLNDLVEGNLLSGNTHEGLLAVGASGNLAAGNVMGLDATGTAPLPNSIGVWLFSSSSNNTIGGVTTAARNYLSGNSTYGIAIEDGSNDNRVMGNYIGTDTSGNNAVANLTGVEIGGGPLLADTTGLILGTDGDGVNDAAEGNLISGNSNLGVWLFFGTDNKVAGNTIGLNAAGTLEIVAGTASLEVGDTATGNTIGTDGSNDAFNANERNIISNSVVLRNANTFAGNYVGLNAAGTSALSSGTRNGVQLIGGVGGTLVGTNGDGIADVDERNVISGINGTAIRVLQPNATIAGNYIGTDVTGSLPIGNSIGVDLLSLSARVGTNGDGVNDAAERNVVSGNVEYGVVVGGGSGHKISGNYLGVNAAGTGLLDNGFSSMAVFHAEGVTIGTDGSNDAFNANERNVISGNVILEQDNAGGPANIFAGNYVGINAAGTASLGKHGLGVQISGTPGQPSRVGTNADGIADALERNVISGINGPGILASHPGAVIAGNYIGTDPTGAFAIPNQDGVKLDGNGNSIRIGTNADGVNDAVEGNLISGNAQNGVHLTVGNLSDVIAGNTIGLSATGTPLPNQMHGVWIEEGSGSNTVGGVVDTARNVISSNGVAGVLISGVGSDANYVIGNYIGTNAAGTAASANTVGVSIGGGASVNQVGTFLLGQHSLSNGPGLTFSQGLTRAPNGDIYVSDFDSSAIYRVDQLTGARTLITAGGLVVQPDLAFDSVSGLLYAADPGSNAFRGAVYSVDPATGTQTLISDLADPLQGPTFNAVGDGATGVVIESSTTLLVADSDGRAIFRINRVTGDRTIVASGGLLLYPANLVLDAAGDLIVTDFDSAPGGAVIRINLTTSAQSYVTSGGFSAPAGLAIAPDGSIIVSDFGPALAGNAPDGKLYRIDPSSGVIEAIAYGGLMIDPLRLAFEPSGSILVADVGSGIVRLTPGGARNVISGNLGSGVSIDGIGTVYNEVTGNYIGTDVTGTLPLGNGGAGVNINHAASYTTIGGRWWSGIGNVISSNQYGVYVSGDFGSSTPADATVISGNLIGTNAGYDPTPTNPNSGDEIQRGTLNLGNIFDGIQMEFANVSTIGGTTARERNVVSGNGGVGITLVGTGTWGNVILGNYIGTNADGTAAIPNESGVLFTEAGANMLGATPLGGNLISGNTHWGVSINKSSGELIQGNEIGLASDGLSSLGNGSGGVNIINGSSNNTIGGSVPAARNVISGNGDGSPGSGVGIEIGNFTSTDNVIQGNWIGLDKGGGDAVGNYSAGIRVIFGKRTVIGGSAAGQGNVIAGTIKSGADVMRQDDGSGIVVYSAEDTLIQGNTIGLNSAGDLPRPNHGSGIVVELSRATIGGTASGSGNVIGGDTENGIRVDGNLLVGNTGWLRAEGDTFDYYLVTGGQLHGGAGYAPGISGQGFSFDGVSGYYDDSDYRVDYSVVDTQGVTYEGWIKTTGNAGTIMNDGGGIDTESGLGLFVEGGRLVARSSKGTAGQFNFVLNGPTVNDGAFHHVALTWTADNTANGAKLYLDGALVAQGTALLGLGLPTTVMHLGGDPTKPIPFFKGVIDEFSIRSVGLTEPEIAGIVAIGGSRKSDDTATIQGNSIGTNAAGSAAIPNSLSGISVIDTHGVQIGGTAVGARNVISGNTLFGIELTGSISTGNLIQGNFIGSTGSSVSPGPIPNGVGIVINGATGNTIGGTEAGAGNVIAFNTGAGLRLPTSSDSLNNQARRNRFIGNGGLGIDIGPAGVTPNDVGDADGFLNAPVITKAIIRGHVLDVSGFSRPGKTIEFYVAGIDPTGFGEGAGYVGTFVEGSADDADAGIGSYSSPLRGLNVGADTTARFRFVMTLPDDVAEGAVITAVAVGSVSEFAGNLKSDVGTVFGAPVVSVGADAYLAEGQSLSLAGAFTDLDSTRWTATVNYGDNTGTQPLTLNPVSLTPAGDEYTPTATGTFNLSHVFTKAGTYTVLVNVTDDSGNTGSAFVVVHVSNSVPEIDNTNIHVSPTVINENQSVTVTGSFTDTSANDTHDVRILWGDGTLTHASVDELNHTFQATHTYLNQGPTHSASSVYAIQVTIVDSSNGAAQTTNGLFQVQVNNVIPSNVQVGLSPADVGEGTIVLASGSFVDPGTQDRHRVVVDWGDGTAKSVLLLAPGVLGFATIHTYVDNPVAPTTAYRVHVDVSDEDEPLRLASAEAFATVRDVAASQLLITTVPTNASIGEGSAVGVSGSFLDPGLNDRHLVTVNWGDASPASSILLQAGVTSFSGLSHVYVDNPTRGVPSGTYAITVSVTDPAQPAGPALTGLRLVTVSNVAPIVTSLSLRRGDGSALFPSVLSGAVGQINENDEVVLAGVFTDPGRLDRHTASIDWGDGTIQTVSVDEVNHSFSARHRFIDNAVGTLISLDTIRVTIADQDTGVGSSTIKLGIANVPPTVAITTGGTDASGNPILLAIGDDAGPIDRAGLVYQWSVTGPNGYAVVGSGASLTLTGTAHLTSYTATVTAYDNDNVVASSTLLVTLLDDNDNVYQVPAPGPGISAVAVFGLGGTDIIAAGHITLGLGGTPVVDGKGVPIVTSPLSIPVILDGGQGTDTLIGGEADDVLNLHQGNDKGFGLGGNDRYVMTPNSVLTVVDGTGANTLDFGPSNFGVTFDMNLTDGTSQNVQPSTQLHFVSVNDLGTGTFPSLYGSGKADELTAAPNTTLNGGAGDDRFYVRSKIDKPIGNVTIRGGADADILNTSGPEIGPIIFNGDDGANSLINSGDITGSLIFTGGADIDTLTNQADAVIAGGLTFNGDDGANSLQNFGTISPTGGSLIFNGGADLDTLINGPGASILGALVFNGDDGANSLDNFGTISPTGGSLIFTGGADADILTNEPNATIGGSLVFNGDDGANSLQNFGTISPTGGSLIFNGGADADSLINKPNAMIGGSLTFNGDDGANSLDNFGTISPTGGSLIFTGGADADILTNEPNATIGGSLIFNGDDGANSLQNLGSISSPEESPLVFTGGADIDKFINFASGRISGWIRFNGDDGADIFQNFGTVEATGGLLLSGGADSDTVVNQIGATILGFLTFKGDDGADSLVNLGTVGDEGGSAKLIFEGGADSDTLRNAGDINVVLTFNGDDGADSLVNGAMVGGNFQAGTIQALVFTGGADSDTLLNPGVIASYLTFNGDDGADSLMNGALVEGVLVPGTVGTLLMNGGADIDTLLNPGTVLDTITFNGDDGADTLVNGAIVDGVVVPGQAASLVFTGGADADTLSNPGTVADFIIFNGDAGVDRLLNQGPVPIIVFNGGADGDLLFNQASNLSTIQFNADDGANQLVNDGSGIGSLIFNGGADADVLENRGADIGFISFTGGAGSDTLVNSGKTDAGSRTVIQFAAGAGADTLINSGSAVLGGPLGNVGGTAETGSIEITFNGDDGADTLVNTGDNVASLLFLGGADIDALLNTGADLGTITFYGDDGADAFRNDGSVVGDTTFLGGADADLLVNNGTLGNIVFNAGDGANGLANTGKITGSLVFNGGADVDILSNRSTGSIEGGLIFNGGADADTIYNSGFLAGLSFSGDDGADLLSNLAGGTILGGTFEGGADADRIVNQGAISEYTFNGDDGADSLGSIGAGSLLDVTFNGGADIDTLIIKSGASMIGNVTFNGGDGADLFSNAADGAADLTFNGDAGADRFWNAGNEVLGLRFTGGSDADTLVNNGSVLDSIIFNGDDGADSLYNNGLVDTLLFNGGADADLLSNTADNLGSITFNGDDGADSLSNTGSNIESLVFNGGADADTLINAGSEIGELTFNGDDGADTLNNTGNEIGTLVFNGGADTDTLNSSGDAVMTLRFDGGPGSNTLIYSGVGGPESSVTFLGGSGNDVFILPNSGSASTVDFEGGDGKDQALIAGSASELTLAGGEGDDTYTFVGSPVANLQILENSFGTIDASADTLDFSGFTAGALTLDLALTTPQILSLAPQSDQPWLTLTLSDGNGIENVVGTALGDTIYGNDRPNVLTTAALDARLIGGNAPAGGGAQPNGSRVQWVLLEFDADTDVEAGEHVYTPEERNAIQARIEGLYHGPDAAHPWFNVFFTRDRNRIPAELLRTGDFATLYFNRTPSFNRPGGEASEVDLGNTNLGGYASIQVNGLTGGVDQPATTSDSIVKLSSKIAAHELGHLLGIRHSDVFGPVGLGLHSPPGDAKFNPGPGGPAAAYETYDHLISSPATVGSDRFNDLRDLSFGPREAIKLAIGDHGVTTPEQREAHGTIQTAQPLSLDPLLVPNTSTRGMDAGKVLNVGASLVSGYLGIDPATGRNERDVYAIQGMRGDILAFEIDSTLLARLSGDDSIDSILRIYDAEGNLVPYYGGTAVNDDQFEPTDSLLLDVVLPATGTYYVEVDSFSRSEDDPIFDPANPNSPINPDNVGSILNPLNPNFDRKKLDNFLATKSGTDTGGYDLLIYRYKAVNSNVLDVANRLEGRGGDDTLLGTTGTDILIGGAGRDLINDGNGGPNYGIGVSTELNSSTVSRGVPAVGSASIADPSGSEFWDVTVDYGDGTSTQEHTTSPRSISLNHAYADGGDFTITIIVTNDDGLTGRGTTNVKVQVKTTPTVTVSPSDAVYTGQAYAGATASVKGVEGASVTVPGVTFVYFAAADATLANPLASTPADVGTYQVVARFAGSEEYFPAESAPARFSITPALLSVRVTNLSRPYGASNPTLGGTVFGIFGNDNVVVSYATSAVTTSDAGSYPITASLSGSKAFDYVLIQGAGYTPGVLAITQVAPTLSLVAPSTKFNGQPYALTTVNLVGVNKTTLSPTGITFKYYNASDVNRLNPLPSAPSSVGSYFVVATYPGSLNYLSVSSQASFSITPRSTTVSVTSSAPGVLPGQTATFKATVMGGLAAPNLPTGTVQFQVDGVNAGQPVPIAADGTASFSTSWATSGNHLIAAVYSGSSSFATSRSANLSQTVLASGSTVVGSVLYLIGGAGADSIQINATGSKLDGSTGIRLVASLNGSPIASTFTQAFSSIVINGFNGNDSTVFASTITIPATITEGDGDDSLVGGNGDMTVVFGNGSNSIQLGDGNNNVTVGDGANVIVLGNGDNVVVEGNGKNSVTAGNGSNLIVAGLGEHAIRAGNGNNILIDGAVTLASSSDSLRKILADWKAGNAAGNTVNSRIRVVYNSVHPSSLIGGLGRNWFFYTSSKTTANPKSTDKVN